MDTSKAWSQLFEVYTDGDNVWAMHEGRMLATVRIGQDIDGPEVALETAMCDLVRAIVEKETLAVIR